MEYDLTFGAYGPYVWSCFGLTAAVLIGNVIHARLRLRASVARARQRLAEPDAARRPTVTRHA